MTRRTTPADDAARWIGITIVLAAVFVVLLMAAGFIALTGGGAESPVPVGSATPTASTASGSPTASPSPSGATSPSPATSPGPSQAAISPSPSPLPSASPSPAVSPSPGASPSGSPDLAAGCSGTDDIDFFRGAASGLSFDVYCASLPARWYLQQGSWRGTSGGRFEATYRGPGGATLTLREGAFCGDDDDCLPGGFELGSAAFGDRPGELRDTDDGYAVIAGEGSAVVYLAETTGLDEATTRALVAALINLG